MKFGSWTPRNCFKIKANGTIPVPKQSSYQGSPKVMVFPKFHKFWTSKLDPKIIKIRFENEVEKTLAFGSQI